VSVLVISLLSAFSIACVGGDTPEVQKPINETKGRYEQFLWQIGVTGSTGMVGAPWIVTPEAGTEVSGGFTVSGWSARPKDVLGKAGERSAYVRVFVVPAAVFEAHRTYRGYEITTASRKAPVDLETGSWTLDATSLADTYEGECYIVAVTHIGGPAGLESRAAAVKVTSVDGASKGNGEAWPAATETIYIATVMVRPEGEEFKAGAERQLAGLVDSVKRYYRDVSRGRVQVELVYAAGVKDLGMTDAQISNDDNEYVAHVEDAISWIPEDKRPPDGAVFALIAAQPGPDGRNEKPQGRSTHSISWVHFDFAAQHKWRGSFINLPLDQSANQDMIGVVAHEIAHGLGSFPGTAKESLPDLYENPDKGYTPADFNNFDELAGSVGFNPGNYFLMANNRAVSPSAFSQEWLGWLSYKDVALKGMNAPVSITVPYLDGVLGEVTQVPRVVWTEPDGRQSFTVVEGRSRARSTWEARLPAEGVVIYKIRSAMQGERSQSLWPRSINWCPMINGSNWQFFDVAQGYIIRRTGELTGGAAEQMQVLPVPSSGMSTGAGAGAAANALVGATMRTEIPDVAWGDDRIFTVRGEVEQAPPPDMDLHAYLADGTHIGVNPETGIFENPVSGALVSGDMVMDAEWILLPAELAKTARFEITSEDAAAFVEAFPDAVPEGGLDLGYSVEPTLVDAATDAITRGEVQSGTLKAGEAVSTRVSDTKDVTLAPLTPGSSAQAPPVLRPLVWQLGAAALLLVIGLLFLLVPMKKR
jgi:M6 family metalloprotease-like protein